MPIIFHYKQAIMTIITSMNIFIFNLFLSAIFVTLQLILKVLAEIRDNLHVRIMPIPNNTTLISNSSGTGIEKLVLASKKT